MLRRETLRKLTALREDDLARVGGGGRKQGVAHGGTYSVDCDDTLGFTSKFC